MAERWHANAGPAGLELRVEVHWCVQCHAERTVQVVQLASDPEPVALCAECGAGVDMWLSAELVDRSAALAQLRPVRRRAAQQGAA